MVKPSLRKQMPGDYLKVEVVSDFQRLLELAPAWTRIHEAGRRPEVFQSFPWIRAVWSSRQADTRLAVLLATLHGEPVGFLPLFVRDGLLRFLATPAPKRRDLVTSDYNDLLALPGMAVPVLRATVEELLREGSLRWDRCVFENVPADGNFAAAHSTLPRDLKSRIVRTARFPCPTLLLEDDCERVLNERLNKKSLKRKVKRAKRLGKLTFTHLLERAEIRKHLDAFFTQHSQRWILAGESAQFDAAGQRAFFEALVDELEPRDTLRFGVLSLDNQPIAYHFGFQYLGKLVWYKPTFDVSRWDESPGQLLIRSLLLYCAEQRMNELDFTVGGEEFKYQYANHERMNESWVLHKESSRAIATRFKVGLRDTLRTRMPMISAGITAARAAIRADREEVGPDGLSVVARRLAEAGKTLFEVRDESLWWGAREPVSAPRDRDRESPPGTESELACRPGTLSDLADLALSNAPGLSVAQVREARCLMRLGHELYLALSGDVIVMTAWLCSLETWRKEPPYGSAVTFPGTLEASLMHNCRVLFPPTTDAMFSGFLRALLAGPMREANEVYVMDDGQGGPSQSALRAMGFQRARQVRSLRLVGRICYVRE